jgi:hypothetical protein
MNRTAKLFVAALAAVALFATAIPAARPGAAADEMPAGIDPATGEPPGAPTGCCCFPKLHPTDTERLDCKPDLTEFDCKAECAQLKDGRLPSGCKWTVGSCAP